MALHPAIVAITTIGLLVTKARSIRDAEEQQESSVEDDDKTKKGKAKKTTKSRNKNKALGDEPVWGTPENPKLIDIEDDIEALKLTKDIKNRVLGSEYLAQLLEMKDAGSYNNLKRPLFLEDVPRPSMPEEMVNPQRMFLFSLCEPFQNHCTGAIETTTPIDLGGGVGADAVQSSYDIPPISASLYDGTSVDKDEEMREAKSKDALYDLPPGLRPRRRNSSDDPKDGGAGGIGSNRTLRRSNRDSANTSTRSKQMKREGTEESNGEGRNKKSLHRTRSSSGTGLSTLNGQGLPTMPVHAKANGLPAFADSSPFSGGELDLITSKDHDSQESMTTSVSLQSSKSTARLRSHKIEEFFSIPAIEVRGTPPV